MEAESWQDGIEGEEAVEIAGSDESPIRVQAGPGTGKTFALKRRVWRLLEEGEDPESILVCTFARTAANDLRREMSALGVEGAEQIYATTLHSYCFSILKRNDIFESYGRNPRTLLDYEKEFLLNDIKNERDEFGNYHDCKERLRAFEAAWARLQAQEPGWPDNPVDQMFGQELDDWLRFHEGMLVEEIIPYALEYLRDNPNCPERRSFRHVLVDEYQDLNRAEQEVVNLISDGTNLIIVGDEDQSIYSFKHAHPEGISEFGNNEEGIQDINLSECRRCPDIVVNIANNLIANNENRAPRELDPHDENPPGEVWTVQWNSIEEEAQGIAEYVNYEIASGEVDPGEVLVLAPREEFGMAIYDALNGFDVPSETLFHSQLDGNAKDIEDSKAQQAMTLLRLVVDTSDRVALRCWCGFGSQSLRNGSWDRLRNYCLQHGAEPIEALRSFINDEISIPYAYHLENRGKELFQRLSALEELSGQDLLDNLFPSNEEWAESYRTAAESLNNEYSSDDLWSILRSHAIRPETPHDVDYVRVMSLYKSKGLTSDLVIIPGCIQGAIPFVKSHPSIEDERKHIREQRRLFYVSITRTTDKLILSNTIRMDADTYYGMNLQFGEGDQATFIDGGNRVRMQTSQFWRDLGRELPNPVTGQDFLSAHGLI